MQKSAIEVILSGKSFSPVHEGENFSRSNVHAGAIVSFLGKVRSENGDVSQLSIECYQPLAEQEILKFARDATLRWPVDAILIVHRFGDLAPGEPIVFVAAAAAHRRNAFAAVDFLMDYLKSEAPFWKRETRNDASYWIEPSAQDQADKTRWRS
jgi:molybdopterin synthase catalytic subunit